MERKNTWAETLHEGVPKKKLEPAKQNMVKNRIPDKFKKRSLKNCKTTRSIIYLFIYFTS